VKKYTDPADCEKISQVHTIPKRGVTNWLVGEEITADGDKAQIVIDQLIGKNLMTEGLVSLQEFYKLFQKGMFCNSLTRIQKALDQCVKDEVLPESISLRRKL